MKDKFSKFINLQGKYLTSLLFVLFFAVGQMWAADPDYESYDWDSDEFAAVVGTHGSVTISAAGLGSSGNVSGHYYFNLNQNLKNSDSSWKYFGIASTNRIDSIEVLYCTNSNTTSLTNLAWVAWGKGVTPNQYTLGHGVTSGLKSKNKSWDDKTWEKIDLSGIEAYTVYLSRSIREFREIGGSSNIANFGGSQTVNILGIRVWLHKYTVTLNPDGGAYASTPEGWTLSEGKYTTSVLPGASLSIPAGLEKSGNTFNGWKNKNSETVSSTFTVSKDTVLTAQWTASGATQSSIIYTNTKEADLSALPTKYYEGTGVASFEPLADVGNWHFTGWNPASISAAATGDQTIDAQWTQMYTVSFALGAGTGTSPAGFLKWEGAKFNLPGQGDMVAPTGKAFDGWKANGTGDKLAAGAEYTMGNAAVEFVAQWKTAPTVLFHYQWTGSSTQPAVGDVLNGTGGTMTVERKEGSTKTLSNESAAFKAGVPDDMKFTGSTSKGIKFGTSDVYFHIALTSGKFKEGDTIKICGYESFIVSSSNASSAGTGDISADLATGVDKDNYEVKWCVIPEVADCDLYVRRNGNSCGFAAIKVIRPAEREIISTTVELTGASINDVALTSSEFATLTTDPAYKFESASKYTTAPTIKFNKRTTITYDEGDPKVTNEVVSVVAEEVSSKWQAQATIGTTTYTITAVKPVSYTVTYYDGETEIGTEVVEKDASPVEYAAKQAKAHYDFVAWYNNADLADEHKIADISALVISANTPVYGKWTPIYAESIDLEAEAGEESPTAINTFFANHKYTSEIGTTGAYDANGSAGYHGYKFKDNGDWIEFLLKAGDRAVVTFGYCSKMTVNYGASSEEVVRKENSYADKIYANETANDMLVKITNTTSTSVINKIVIGEIPAASDDATLSDLTLKYGEEAAATISGFSASKFIYNIEVPYGTAKADLPIVGATATDVDHALVTIKQAKDREDWKTVIRVQAEDRVDEHDKYYEVRFNVATKQGVELIKALTSTDLTDGVGDATGYIGGKYYSNNGKGSTRKLDSNTQYGLELAGDATFQEGDMFIMNITTAPGSAMGTMKIYESADATEPLFESSEIGVVGVNYWTLPAAVNGKKTLYIKRGGGNDWNPTFSYIAVQRYMAPFIEKFKIGEAVGTITGTSIAIELQHGTSLDGVSATVKAWANGGATVDAPSALSYNTPLEYTVSSAYAEDAPVAYTVTISEADHYEAMIVGGANYETLAAAVSAADADDVVKLLDNVDLMATGLTIAENITLDLNGFNIKAGEQATNDIMVPAGKKLTLVDNSTGADGKIYTEEAYTASAACGVIRVAGEFLMQSGNIYTVIESNPVNLGQFAVVIASGGKVTVEGGRITAGWYAISNNGLNSGSTIIVSGGELISTVDYAIYNPSANSTVTVSGGVVYGAAGGIVMNRGDLTVTGGIITSNNQGTTGTWGDGTGGLGNAAIYANGKYESVTVEISGGTVVAEGGAIMITNGTINPVEIAISGGQFSHVVPAEYCAKDFVPVTTPNLDGKYEVQWAGVIRAAATQMEAHGNAYAVTLDNGIVIISSNSDGKFDTNNQFDNSAADAAVALGADKGKYRYKGQHILLNFPKNVKEFTIYSYDNNTTDRKINKVTVGGNPATEKLKNNDAVGEYTFTNNTETKLRTMTATFSETEYIAAGEYVYVGLSNAHTVFRVIFTEAPCTTPVINSTNATSAKVGENATLTVDASAVGATYKWYRRNDLGEYVLIQGATASKYVFEKVAGTEYFKVVVGCNCSDETDEAIIVAEEWVAIERTNVTGYTEWSWDGVFDGDGPTIDEASKGLVLASYINAPNFDKLEGNQGGRVYRSNTYKAYQGTSLKFTTEVPGMLIIDASYTNDGYKIAVNGHDMGALPKNHAANFKIAVASGDVTLTSEGMRIWAMTFDPDMSNYTKDDNKLAGDDSRTVTEGRYGTICLPKAGIMSGATIFEIAYMDYQDNKPYKIYFDEVLHGEMVAGMPYIFLPEEGATNLNVFFTGSDDQAATEAGHNNGLYGSFDQIPLEKDAGIYILKNNQYWYVNSDNVVCVANRAYIKLAEVPDFDPGQPAYGRRRVALGVNAENAAQGFENIESGDAPMKVMIEGTLYILRGEKVYDATGRLVK